MADFDPIPPPPVKLRRFDDIDTLRNDIYDQAKTSFTAMRPVANATHRLEVSDVDYDDGDYTPTLDQEKAALLKGGSMTRPLHGTVKLIDQATNTPVDEKRMVLARIPHLNSRGLFIRNGVVWALRNQQRLRPGIYTRRQNNGGVETMFNTKPGTGRGFRMNLEPDSGLLKLQIGQSTTRLYPVMKALGYSDDQLKDAWGDELFLKNQRDRGGHDVEDLKKVVRKLGKPDLEVKDADLPQTLRDILNRNEVDEDTTELTLGQRIKHLNPDVLLHGSKKILAVARGEDPGDNRDAQAFQSVHSAEDFIRDRLTRDQAGVLRKALWRGGRTNSLEHLPPAALDKNLNALFEGSGLSLSPEQVNPFETYDQRQAITRLGEGGISSQQAVSREARDVQPSYLGSIDQNREPESSSVGLDLRTTDSALKGSDNQLYTMLRNTRTGEVEPVSTKDLARKTVTFPGELKREGDGERVPVVHGNTIKYVPKTDVDYELVSPNQMMSRASAMIPAPQSIEGKRLLMGARMSVSGVTPILVRRADGTAYYGPIEAYERQDGDLSLSIDKTSCQLVWKAVRAHIKHRNVKRMHRVTLRSGRVIDATADHSFVTLAADGTLCKVHTQDLVAGVPVPLAGTIPPCGNSFEAAWQIPAGKKYNAHPEAFFKLDFELGWIHGLYVAEGYLNSRHQKDTAVQVTFANCDHEVLNRAATFFHNIGVDCRPMSGRRDGKLDRLRVHWTQLGLRLRAEYGDGAYKKKIPGWVFFAPREFREGFLAGYLAGDGGVQPRRDSVRVNGSSRSHELVIGFGNLCATLGIATSQRASRVNTGPGGSPATQHYFEIRTEHVHKLPKIGQLRKDTHIARAKPWSGKKSADWFPIYGALRAAIMARTRRKSEARQRIYVNQHTRATVTEVMGVDALTVPWLMSGVWWDSVVSVTMLDSADYEFVYDLDMDDNVFMCGNGVFVHNTQQALPLQSPEAPLVQTAGADGQSLHQSMGEAMGAVKAAQPGVVTKVDQEQVTVRQADGTDKSYALYNNYPHSRKTALHNTPSVQVGQLINAGQLLAKSNYTDDRGTMALGKNLRTAFMVAQGNTIEDALVISESAAKKLTSESMYKHDLDLKGIHSTDRGDYQAVYADKFKPEQYEKIGDDGVIKIGQEVQLGDPLILAIGNKPKRGIGALMNSPRAQFSDKTEVWDHNAPGTVTDVQRTRSGIKVLVKSFDTSQIGDKISGLYGNKGVVSEVKPDEQMPVDQQGRPVEVLMNALGTISRKNPGALVEGLLGKVAEKTGRPYVLKPFDHPDITQFALDEGMKHGLVRQDAQGNPVDTETLTDPTDGRQIHSVFVGNSYLMKLHHQAESKLQARDAGSYTTEGIPAKGGYGGSKRIAVLDTNSLLSSGATEFLRDAKIIRGQRNDDYWRSLRAGDTPVEPTETFANQKFKDMLTAAGVNLREKGSRTQLTPLLDKDVEAMAGHEIENGKTLDFESLEPEAGGLFDVSKTGGVGGNRFAQITLPEKVPHPLFVDAIQKLLNVTGKKLEGVLTGKDELNGKTGPQAVEQALQALHVDREIENAKLTIKTGTQTAKDIAVKRLNYLAGLKNTGTKPEELMISKIPVIPPKHRPVITGQNVDVVHDLNYLYHDLLESKTNYNDAKKTFGDAGDEYLTMAHAVGAISGLRDPVNPKTHEQGVKGVLKSAIGIGDSPKGAVFQYKVIGSAVDQVGRGTITADKNLDMDEVSIPKDMAWEVFRPYVIRQLRRQGMPATEAMKSVRERTPRALDALQQEMQERPVVYNRAPALHRFAYTGAYAKIRDDDAIGLPYATLKSLGADYDGDAINLHVPSGEAAVQEVKQKLLPSTALKHPGTFETHYEPVQDYLAGLHLATTPDPKQKLRVFSSEDEAKAAYKRGEISARTPIRILPS